jgi:putative phosphoribosyl transferase
VTLFADRIDAGVRLARALHDVPENTLFLGIPRGGVIVARVVADRLQKLLDVIVVRKLGAPGNPELAIGAIGPDGSAVLDQEVIAALDGVRSEHIEAEVARNAAEMKRRTERYRAGRGLLDVKEKTCVVVDDGIATGSTARAALMWLRGQGAGSVILAVPVAPEHSVETLKQYADRVVCLTTPPHFYAVGQWYQRFDEVTDEQVMAALARDAAA